MKKLYIVKVVVSGDCGTKVILSDGSELSGLNFVSAEVETGNISKFEIKGMIYNA